MTRPYNFSAGPATLPEPVLEQAARDMLNWQGSGMGVMEMSHRGAAFTRILQQAEADLRQLLAVPPDMHVLFMQGGGIGQNAIVPMNLAGRRAGRVMDFVLTGSWSRKSQTEARKYGLAHTAIEVPAGTDERPLQIPPAATWRLSDDAAYVHLCSNETIDGVEFQQLPDLSALGSDAPLVIDCSSHVASRPMAWDRIGLAFAGAQKNIGPAGLTMVFVRDDLLGHALDICPTAFNYRLLADNQSMVNTPPTYSIYIAGLVFQWLLAQREGDATGVAAIESRNIAKAQLLYQTIDGSGGFYRNRIHPACRSRMNVPFLLRDERLNEAFLSESQAAGLLSLKGHKSVGGMRASLYNAMPIEGVRALTQFMNAFAARHG